MSHTQQTTQAADATNDRTRRLSLGPGSQPLAPLAA